MNNAKQATDPAVLISRKTGDWWQDDRRNWCAYCGVAVRVSNGEGKVPSTLTRDHVIPRVHKGRHVTIPCCNECNVQKGKTGLPEFMLTEYFTEIRQAKRHKQWSLRDLWLVMAMAAVEQARGNAERWPAEAVPPTPPASILPAKAKTAQPVKAKAISAATTSGSPGKQAAPKPAKPAAAKTGASDN